jgi:hypothetical protein
MVRFICSLLRLIGNGLRSIARSAVCLFNEIVLAMPMRFNSSAIALSYLSNNSKMTKGGVACALKNFLDRFFIVIAFMMMVLTTSSANATIINNTATVNHSLGTLTASVNVDAAIRTPSSIELYQYAPGVSDASNIPIMPSEYSTSSATTGPFSPSTPATDLSGGSIATPGNHDLMPISAIKSGEPIFIRLTDGDQNNDPALAEMVVIEIGSSLSGDTVIVRLTETGPNTGEFTGYVQTISGTMVANDEFLSVNINDSIRVS